MQLLQLSLETPEENLALDEALLDEADSASAPRETLRIWESRVPVVVLGRSSQWQVEVDEQACQERGVPILRRASGGATIVAGQGSLMYALVFNLARRPELRSLDAAHRYVLDTHRQALAPLMPAVARQGISDLAVGELKFSGNSVRCKRRAMLYHGTLLYAADLELIAALLRLPPRQPDYRRNRSHGDFLTNLPLPRSSLVQALVLAWQAQATDQWPREQVARLVAERYALASWSLQR